MEKRLILAAVLSVLVIIFYQFLLTRVYPPSIPVDAGKEEVKEEAKEGEARPFLKSPSQPIFKVEKEEGEVEVVVDTPLYRAILSSRGGLKSWKLKKYRVELAKDSGGVEMVSTSKRNLYPLQLFDNTGKPLTLSPSMQDLKLSEGDEKTLVLKGVSSEGIDFEERLTFSGDNYDIGMEIAVTNPTEKDFSGVITLNLFKALNGAKSNRYTHIGPVSYTDEGVVTDDVNKLTTKEYQETAWTGLEEKYFLLALIPSEKAKTEVGKVSEDIVYSRLLYPLSLPPGGSTRLKMKSYTGPKDIEILKGFGVHLEDTIDFGVFSIIGKPLLAALKFFYKYVGNYGIATIILTVIIKIIFHPLSLHSLRSMKEMQKIQPQIAVLKERYKKDKEKMNKELMELYKRSKINPLGGCLPILLQIPVFIALYNVLLLSIELRHAPFFLWIKDLSAKDPYYITPLLMGASMFIQQKMSPTAMDPQQAKMMLIMPVVFTFLFLNFPSGLVIYWLVNNILSIAQQYYMQKRA